MASIDPAKEHPLLLRLPKDIADKLRRAIRTDTLGERLQLEFTKDPLGTMRYCRVKFEDDIFSAKLVDLPCIVETHKTLDRKTVLKTGDISQMVVCSRGSLEDEGKDERIDEMTAAKKKELYKKFVWNHGITPPMKNVRKRRFRKTKTKKMIESPEVEKEVKRLLRADTFAANVSFRVVNEEDKHIDDSQSIASDFTPLTPHQSQLLQEEDSLLSNPASYQNLSDDKEELLRMLEEASCSSSSSSSEDSEDEDISVVEESPESEEVNSLRLAIQDLENQIEEQKFKIQSTPMPLLRGRFETFLNELEKQKRDKMEQLELLTK